MFLGSFCAFANGQNPAFVSPSFLPSLWMPGYEAKPAHILPVHVVHINMYSTCTDIYVHIHNVLTIYVTNHKSPVLHSYHSSWSSTDNHWILAILSQFSEMFSWWWRWSLHDNILNSTLSFSLVFSKSRTSTPQQSWGRCTYRSTSD